MSIYWIHLFLYVYGHLQMFKIFIYVIFCPDLIFLYQNKILYYLLQYSFLVYGVSHHFQQYFSYIVVVSFIGGGNQSTGENHRPVASHWQTWSLCIKYTSPWAGFKLTTLVVIANLFLVYLEHSYVELSQKNA